MRLWGSLPLIGIVACSSFGSSGSDVADASVITDAGAGADADAASAADAGDASSTPATFSVPCGAGFCTDPVEHCCNGACGKNACSTVFNDYVCNDAADCEARGQSGTICCGRIDGQNMAGTRCALVCLPSEVHLCDASGAAECRTGTNCTPYSNLNEGGFASCQ